MRCFMDQALGDCGTSCIADAEEKFAADLPQDLLRLNATDASASDGMLLVRGVGLLVERFDIEPFPDFSAK